jgi:uncharacterized protein YuzE
LKYKYIKENDILIIILTHGRIEYVEKAGPINIHFSTDKKPIIIEILNASKFLTEALNFTEKDNDYKRSK